MAKIIVSFNGLVQQELTFNKSRLSIGRRPTNDLVIDHLTVSGQHAAIDTSGSGCFIVDLGSTNGTMVNGQPVKKHLLQHDDVISIGKYQLRFLLESAAAPKPAAPSAPVAAAPSTVIAKIKVLSGANAGRELILSKPVTTMGSPGVQVVAITRQGQHYLLAQVEGASLPTVNGKNIGTQAHILADGDVITLAGTQMLFTLGGA
ncbi:MAG: FHA domain-containing protein [Burkholderiales bacterium]|nr:FHA domain-containing protein [Burkholderiales bacterium]